jgi:hypothetical protein
VPCTAIQSRVVTSINCRARANGVVPFLAVTFAPAVVAQASASSMKASVGRIVLRMLNEVVRAAA